MFTNKTILFLLILLINFVKSDDKCRILVLEGGGDRGAYHAGNIIMIYYFYLDINNIFNAFDFTSKFTVKIKNKFEF